MDANQKWIEQQRNALLEQLRKTDYDPGVHHARAEDLLLAYVEDREITEAWIIFPISKLEIWELNFRNGGMTSEPRVERRGNNRAIREL